MAGVSKRCAPGETSLFPILTGLGRVP